MTSALSIRSYTRQYDQHSHDHHQLVIPLNGFIDITVGDFAGKVGVSEGIVIKTGVKHTFRADEKARFVVADLTTLPSNLLSLPSPKFSVDTPFMAFLHYIEAQLTHHSDEAVIRAMVPLFLLQLTYHTQIGGSEDKIATALQHIHQDVSAPLSINHLASLACLGETQFKKRFKASTGKRVGQYVIELRMQKAKALLSYTDRPVTHVAFDVGYNDVSAFTRRFREHFGCTPKQFSKRAKYAEAGQNSVGSA